MSASEAEQNERPNARTISAEARSRLNPPLTEAGPESFADDRCANCFQHLPEEIEMLFCSEWCKETASSVRYFRGVSSDGRLDDPEVQEAVKIRLAFLPVGGYQALGRQLSRSIRNEVIQRDQGSCRHCGAPANQVDHVAGSSSNLNNLQLLCDNCHREKTSNNLVDAPADIQSLIAELIMTRVVPDEPTRLADNGALWESTWRALKAARRQRLIDLMRGQGIEVAGLRTRAELLEVFHDYNDDNEVMRREWLENRADFSFGSNDIELSGNLTLDVRESN